jgi:type IV secretion system protein VirB2
MIASLADPVEPSVLVAAVQWLEQTMLGTLATMVAIIAVAALGFMMLTGRVDYRRGATVILGCFILFGASSIVAGIQAALAGADQREYASVASSEPAPSPITIPPDLPRYDPYAGASVPTR